MLRTIALWVAFDGTEFHGWQDQLGPRTVQDEVQQVLRRVVRHPVSLLGSGRTDAGVHAAGHVSSFVTTCELPADRLLHALASRLPEDISIVALREVHSEFHATRSALSKLYRYRVHAAVGRPVEAGVQAHVHHFWEPLDVERMRSAARSFVGTMDFAALAAKGDQRETTVRTVFRCDVERHLDEIRIDVEGDGFLYKQVRTMAGTLLNVGRGHWEPRHVVSILESRDRAQAGPTAPAQGLCLEWVRYPAHLLRPSDPEPNAECGMRKENTGGGLA